MIDAALLASARLTNVAPIEGRNDPVDFQNHLEALLAEVNALSAQLKWAGRSGDTGDQLLPAEASVLQTIAKLGPQTVPQIARARLNSRQNIQVLVNRLIADGCVEANRNPRHKRSVVVSLTTHGRQLFARSANRLEDIIKDFSMRVSAKRVSEAVEILNQLRSRLAEGVGGRHRKPDPAQPRSPGSDLENTSPAFGKGEPELDELPVNLL
jgi:DNA-binding MarR family transcriptional regulator